MNRAGGRVATQHRVSMVAGLVVVCGFLLGCEPVHYARSKDGRIITRSMVRSVQPGMTMAEVEARLGPPLVAKFFQGGATLTYGESKALSDSSTRLWIHLDDAGRVREVYAKLYGTWALDDESGVYGRGDQPTWEAKLFPTAFPE